MKQIVKKYIRLFFHPFLLSFLTFQIEGEPTKISENDRVLIKTNIVELMLKSPESIQRQLSDAISIIGKEDFPEKWKDLLGVLYYCLHFLS